MLKIVYYGQNDGAYGPDVNLTGDPGTDNTTLTTNGYLGGKVVTVKTSGTAGRGNVIAPCDADAGQVPYGFLINGPGEFAGAIGPSGSGKMGVVRAFPNILVDSQAYVSAPNPAWAVGQPVYCGGGANAGLVNSAASAATGGYKAAIGTITSIPTASAPWLGIASLL